MEKKLSIVVIGSRGIPNVQGGIETHCEKLYPRIAASGMKVTVFGASSYLGKHRSFDYEGVHVRPLPFCFRINGLEAFCRTFGCLPYVFLNHPDVVHLHGIGPSFLAPLFRLCGAKVVYTHHGRDYERARWGWIARFILRLGERIGCTSANRVIVISTYLENFLKTKYGCKKTELIHNGVDFPKPVTNASYYLEKWDLTKGRYVFACGRFVKEKGFHDLIEAFAAVQPSGYKLVIAGAADQESSYSKKLKERARKAGVVLTGFIKGDELSSLYANAALFVIPSYHEGLPIVLLEAMSYGLNIIASDIPANKEVALPEACFYPVGDVSALAKRLSAQLGTEEKPQDFRSIIREEYNWDKIAEETEDVYLEMVGK